MKKSLLLGIVLATAGLAQAAVPNSLLYHGRLAKEGEKLDGRVLMMTFSIYDGAEATTPVWTLTDSFRLGTEGEFTAELKDEKLADALASVKGDAYIALTPAGGTEFPRQKLELYPRAARAARAKSADIAKAKQNVYAKKATLSWAGVESVTVPEGGEAILPQNCTLSGNEEHKLGGSDKTEVVVKKVTTQRDAFPAAFAGSTSGCFVTTATASDMIVVYDDEDGAYSLVLPKGSSVSANGKRTVQTVQGNSFGRTK